MTMLQHGAVPSTGGYNIERSLRFNSADSAYLNRTPASAGNRKTWTVSFWLKKSIIETRTAVCGNPDASGLNGTYIEFNTSDLNVGDYGTSSWNWFLATYDVFRDPSAWYHFVIAVDTTQATASNRVKIYVNNRQITVFDSTTYPSLNADTFWNNNQAASIGRLGQYDGFYLNGYLTDFYNIGGQQLDPSSFGENDTDTGVWKPKAYTGSYGTNGFKLTFSDNSGTTSTTLGKDSSGNGNNWTPNNFSVTAGAGNDSLVDTPTPYGSDTGAGGEVRGNYATWNPVDIRGTGGASLSITNGNLQTTGVSGNWRTAKSTIGMSSGKWYCEATLTSISGTLYARLGLANSAAPTDGYLGVDSNGWAYTASWSVNDVIGIAFNADTGSLQFYLNGSLQGTSYSGLTSGPYFFAISIFEPSVLYVNFGQRPFAYTAPSGYKALCTINLPTPAIGATSTTRADDYFNTVLYTGDGTKPRTITGVGFQPDLVWIKQRDTAGTIHFIQDAVRGVTSTDSRSLSSNATTAETNYYTTNGGMTAFTSDGFTTNGGSTNNNINANGATYVTWNWKANGAGSSNTQGTITSTVSANTTSGFSIVTYNNGSTSAQTIGHGLGVAPDFIICKGRTTTFGWPVYHKSLGKNAYLILNGTDAQNTSYSDYWGTSVNSTTFGILGNGYWNGQTDMVAYCFAEVAGFSKFGSYTGNGSADGPFVYTNHRPAFLMVKRTDTTADWVIVDTARIGYNIDNRFLFPNGSYAESASGVSFDILSNGFKARNTNGEINASGGTYIYMSLASNPFKYSLGR